MGPEEDMCAVHIYVQYVSNTFIGHLLEAPGQVVNSEDIKMSKTPPFTSEGSVSWGRQISVWGVGEEHCKKHT